MKKILQNCLYLLARLILKRYKPRIVGITGSVGKTGTKDMMTFLLQKHFRVRGNSKSYNNEFGLPLTIIGSESANSSIYGWLVIILKSVWLIVKANKSYPEILVLEMGADRRGDIEYLTKLAPPDISVLTSITSVHLEFFKTMNEIVREKRTIIDNLKEGGTAVLNIDNEYVAETKIRSDVTVIKYGQSKDADLMASEVKFYFENSMSNKFQIKGGTLFKITYQGNTVPARLKGILGMPAVYYALGAMAVGLKLGLNLIQITEDLQDFIGTPGRLRLIAGIKHTTILDDTYNASPDAVVAALDVLAEIPIESGQKRWVAIGSMAELGSDSEKGHDLVGERIVDRRVDGLITVGERARRIAQSARNMGMDPNSIFTFSNSVDAGKFLQSSLKPGDVCLVKGSQIMRMEKIVKEIMAEPEKAGELLVRQGVEWLGNS